MASAAGRSVSRIYPTANEDRGKAWWDYDQLTVAWGVQDNYEIVRKVGRGKVSLSCSSTGQRQRADSLHPDSQCHAIRPPLSLLCSPVANCGHHNGSSPLLRHSFKRTIARTPVNEPSISPAQYSEVFEGVNVVSEDKCVIKVLKPVKKKKIKREIKILQNLAGGQNIVMLYDVVRDPQVSRPSGRDPSETPTVNLTCPSLFVSGAVQNTVSRL